MKKSLHKLEEDLAKASEAIINAENLVEAATNNVKVTKIAAVKLQKEAYKAERLFKDANEALAKALKKSNAACTDYVVAKKALDAASENFESVGGKNVAGVVKTKS